MENDREELSTDLGTEKDYRLDLKEKFDSIEMTNNNENIVEQQDEESMIQDKNRRKLDDTQNKEEENEKVYSPQIYPTSKTLVRQSRVISAKKKMADIDLVEEITNSNSLQIQNQ
jgi:hypothetical protein